MSEPSFAAAQSPAQLHSGSPAASRDVTLLARHWQWLNDQPGGANVVLRRLVHEARRDVQGKYRAQQIKEKCYVLMRDKAGDSPLFEEACRALFAGDRQRLAQLVQTWPEPLAAEVLALADEVCAADSIQIRS